MIKWLAVLLWVAPCRAFVVGRSVPSSSTARSSTSSLLLDDDADIQWELFQKYHARGSWKGIWTTYDYMGDVVDETVAAVDLHNVNEDTIVHTHTVVVGAKRSDCATCFDSMETKTLPIAEYTRDNLRRLRLGSCAMVNGPTVLRSGAMATELVLSYGDGRVRVIVQHAPVWERDAEPGSAPPSALKLFRTMVSREALRDTPPTAESEQTSPPSPGNPVFCRPVPPFDWHKLWGGTSWTWGPQAGNRGWALEELDEEDAWHGTAPPECWNLRLPGGIFVQAPRLVTGDFTELCRLAWLPDSQTLLRVEAGVQALQPLIDNEELIGFEPPALASLRCDVLQKLGDLPGQPQFALELDEDASQAQSVGAVAAKAAEASARKKADQSSESKVSDQAKPTVRPVAAKSSTRQGNDDDESPDLKALRDALQL